MLKDDSKKDIQIINLLMILWYYDIGRIEQIIIATDKNNTNMEVKVTHTRMIGQPYDI